MSLLKKIFGKSEPEPPPRSYIKRAPRVPVNDAHKIEFYPAGSTGPLPVKNISVGGMGLSTPELCNWKLGDVVAGRLVVDGTEFETELAIRFVATTVSGAEFAKPKLELRRAIESYLKVEILALTLRKVDEKFLKPDPRGPVLWFTDGKKNEFYCVTGPKGVVTFHMNFLGNYVEGNPDTGIRSGRVREGGGDVGDIGVKPSDLLDLGPSAATETLDLARGFVRNLSDLPPEIRLQLEKMLA